MQEKIIIGTIRYRKTKFKPNEGTTFFMGKSDFHRNHIFKFEGTTSEGLVIGSDPYTGARTPFSKGEVVGGYLVIEDGEDVYPIHFKDYPNVRCGQNWAGRLITKPTRVLIKDKVKMVVSGDVGTIMAIENNMITVLLVNGNTTTVRRDKIILDKRGQLVMNNSSVIFEPTSQV